LEAMDALALDGIRSGCRPMATPDCVGPDSRF